MVQKKISQNLNFQEYKASKINYGDPFVIVLHSY